MSRSGYPTFMWLEFERPTGNLAAIGSDSALHIDGRFGQLRAELTIIEKAREIRKRHPDIKLVGFTTRGNHNLRKLGLHVCNAANKDGE